MNWSDFNTWPDVVRCDVIGTGLRVARVLHRLAGLLEQAKLQSFRLAVWLSFCEVAIEYKINSIACIYLMTMFHGRVLI